MVASYRRAAWDLNVYGDTGANGKSGSVEGCRTYAMMQMGPDAATPAALAVQGPPEAGAAVLYAPETP